MTTTGFPSARPITYDESLVWDEDTGTWTSEETTNQQTGGRYRTTAVFVCNYNIYFEALD